MKCTVCESPVNMKCIFTVPLAKTLRYRVYRCICGEIKETVEMGLERMLKLTPEKIEEIRGWAVKDGRERRFLGMRMRRTHR